MAGFQMNEDSAEVRHRLGAPDAVTAEGNPFDAGAELATRRAVYFRPELGERK